MVNSSVAEQTECFLITFDPLSENYIAPDWEAGITRGHQFLARFLFSLLIAVVIALLISILPEAELSDSLK
jgi:hypothetical protein